MTKITIFCCLLLAMATMSIGCANGSEEISHEEEVFGRVTTYMGEATEGEIDDSNWEAWLYYQMQSMSPTNRSDGAIADLLQTAEVSSEFWRESDEGRKEFQIHMETDDGTLEWAIIDYNIGSDGDCCWRQDDQVTAMAWTFNNDRARKWLQDNDFLDACDYMREVGDDGGSEYFELLGEMCRTVIEGGSVD